jgi:N-methylhydantoinase A
LCAFGDATTRLRAERARSLTRTFAGLTDETLRTVLSDLADEVRAELVSEGVPAGEQDLVLEAGVRYSGQAFEVTLPVTLESFQKGGGLAALAAAFDAEHERAFTFKLDVDRELVTLRATALGKAAAVEYGELESRSKGGMWPFGKKASGDPTDAIIRKHRMWADGKEHDALIYDRAKLRAGDKVAGPAIVSEMDSTTVILPGYAAEVDRFGLLLIRPV